MNKKVIYALTIVISGFIPIYFFFIWQPLNSYEVMSQNVLEENSLEKEVRNYQIENLNEGIFNNIKELNIEKREKIASLINELSIVDIIKVNKYFSELENEENVKKGISLLNKRMKEDKYEELRVIIADYINLE